MRHLFIRIKWLRYACGCEKCLAELFWPVGVADLHLWLILILILIDKSMIGISVIEEVEELLLDELDFFFERLVFVVEYLDRLKGVYALFPVVDDLGANLVD